MVVGLGGGEGLPKIGIWTRRNEREGVASLASANRRLRNAHLASLHTIMFIDA
jgi:hypothetical protein